MKGYPLCGSKWGSLVISSSSSMDCTDNSSDQGGPGPKASWHRRQDGNQLLTSGPQQWRRTGTSSPWATLTLTPSPGISPGKQNPAMTDKKQNMYTYLKDNILQKGTAKINFEYTHQDCQPTGRKSCLDHVYSNNPQKISSFTTHYATSSDHAMIEVNKYNKNIQNKIKYI